MMMKVEHETDLKGKKTTYPLIARFMITSKCQGYECNLPGLYHVPINR
jgi:hypothetical protein